ncbi:MAG TPA: hypothetical protein VK864_19525, partial [Longimicrobiales bacterium]|nr:hypothetical protein [Longimicrobiales bacterium]
MPRTALHAALGATLLLAAPIAAQVGTAPPNSYALTNARIVTAPGRTIERGTVVIRNGRITAVGAQVTVPADVQSMDLAGMTVYPGLIDPASALGMPRTSASAARGRGAAPPGPPTQAATARLASNRTEIPEIQPTRLASETVQLQEADVQALRALGFTTVGLAFEPAIIGGQTAVLSLRTTNLDSALLRSPAAVQIGLETRRGGYPTTLMGTLAYLEQAFLDAAHQQRVVEAFERDPARGPRPVHDADRSALLPAVQRKIPVFITASRENDLRRAAALARRLNVDYVLLGAQEAYRATDLLTKENKPVIVSLNYPRP